MRHFLPRVSQRIIRHALQSASVMLAIAFVLPASAAPFAYVSNELSGTISVIDTAGDKQDGVLQEGGKPRGAALNRDGSILYVSDEAANAFVMIDTRSRSIVGNIPIGESPEGVSIAHDGKLIAVASELLNAVVLVDPATMKKVAEIKTSGKNPEHAEFSPDGRWIFAGAEDGREVDVIDVQQRKQIASIEVGRRPRGIAFSPDGKMLRAGKPLGVGSKTLGAYMTRAARAQPMLQAHLMQRPRQCECVAGARHQVRIQHRWPVQVKMAERGID